ncbi:hypothetical protein ABIC28_002040 [Rhodococcus sp. PvR044]|uniref:hypothetical protein n=1 Tax=Rhodococcus sp. PvR044 TaxID=3156402 RepID=UPI003399EF28
MASNPEQAHPACGTHYDTETGDYVMRGGARLTPQGIYLDPDGKKSHGSARFRIRANDGALANAVPPQDGANPQPLPPLVPQGPGWPTAPESFGWPNLENPNSIYDQHN